ncbi:LamG domain-containing protein [Paenibacillus hexagrammi]|uniref:LamG domain-containing protein n=1 Tax=Paenibacillus hexagrammi TaxID=2908839 RepID=A0ABY3SRS8_9BACL|nr:LamG domain-containing protein [Paenibacillus sp. YPD9-1]UJF36626.1 LamG domain-containing protein [Paenibacillus sp. YPD9-1]
MRDDTVLIQILKSLYDRPNEDDDNTYENTLIQFFDAPHDTGLLTSFVSTKIALEKLYSNLSESVTFTATAMPTVTNPDTLTWGGYHTPTTDPVDFVRATIAVKQDLSQVASGVPRYEAGKFGQAIMIEEGTTNRATYDDVTNVDTAQWKTERIAPYTFKVTALVDAPVSQQQTSATYVGKFGELSVASNTSCTMSLEIVDRSNPDLVPGCGGFGAMTNSVGNRYWKTVKHTAVWHHNVNAVVVPTTGLPTVKAGDYIIVRNPQLEVKPYMTTFVPGARNNEKVTLPFPAKAEQGTVEVWVYVNYAAKRQDGELNRVFNVSEASGDYGFMLYHSADSAHWRWGVYDQYQNKTYISVSDSYTPDGWHLFTVTWSSKEIALFIDGVRLASTTDFVLPTTLGSVMNLGSGTSQQRISTLFDEVRISRVARSDAEILAAYQANKPFPIDLQTVYKIGFDGNLNPATDSVLAKANWYWGYGGV